MKDNEILVQLKPLGINLTGPHSRPLLLLKDESGDMTLPIPISPVDAGLLLQQAGKAVSYYSPHDVTQQLLAHMGVQVERCYLHEVKGGQIWCRLELSNKTELEIKAEQAIHLVLFLNVPIYSTREVVWKARQAKSEWQQEEGFFLFQGPAVRSHEYLM